MLLYWPRESISSSILHSKLCISKLNQSTFGIWHCICIILIGCSASCFCFCHGIVERDDRSVISTIEIVVRENHMKTNVNKSSSIKSPAYMRCNNKISKPMRLWRTQQNKNKINVDELRRWKQTMGANFKSLYTQTLVSKMKWNEYAVNILYCFLGTVKCSLAHQAPRHPVSQSRCVCVFLHFVIKQFKAHKPKIHSILWLLDYNRYIDQQNNQQQYHNASEGKAMKKIFPLSLTSSQNRWGFTPNLNMEHQHQ